MKETAALETAIAAALGRKIRALRPLSGGSVAAVMLVELDDGARVVAKFGAKRGGAPLALEGWMLEYLARETRLPVPAVVSAGDDLLIMEYIESGGVLDARCEGHAAALLAALHDVTAPAFGFERATVIGGLDQPNEWAKSWISFFRDRRLLFSARAAHGEKAIDAALLSRLEKFAAQLDKFLEEPAAPSLIHGDMWGGNVLCRNGRIAAFVDPAIYFADAEIELAFATLFSTFGDAFFARYRDLRGLRPGFFETRRDIYNLYPLLVHVRLFGGHYADAVERTLARFGF